MKSVGAAVRYRDEIESILDAEGFRRGPASGSCRRFHVLGKWLVRTDAMPGFLAHKPRYFKALTPLRVVRFAKNTETEEYPLVLVREGGRPKVSFFSPSAGHKKVTWIYEEDFQREVNGAEHFQRAPSRIAPTLWADRSKKSLAQGLVGKLFGKSADLGALVDHVVGVHGASRGAGGRYSEHFGDAWSDAGPRGDPYLDALGEGMRTAREFLENLLSQERLSPLRTAFSHGDMSTMNALLDKDSGICFTDFDLSGVRYADFDLTYLHLTDEKFGREALQKAIGDLNRLLDANTTEYDAAYPAALSRFVLELGKELQERFGAVMEPDKRPSVRKALFDRAALKLRRELSIPVDGGPVGSGRFP